jgi:hypothetical protein
LAASFLMGIRMETGTFIFNEGELRDKMGLAHRDFPARYTNARI